MSHRGRSAFAAVALVLVVLVGWIALGRRPGVPTATMPHAPNELDIDLAAGTPMPPLPTAVPEGWSITTAEQALVRGLQGRWGHAPVQPDTLTVRLLDYGILNTLCDGGAAPIPEGEHVWAVAFEQSGLDTKDVLGLHYNPQPPFLALFPTPDPTQPTPTPRPSPTPEPVAGMVVVLNVHAGYAQYQRGLFDPNASGTRCPTFAMIGSLRSFPDIITPRPTVVVVPMPTSRIDGYMTEGITYTADITATFGITDGPLSAPPPNWATPTIMP